MSAVGTAGIARSSGEAVTKLMEEFCNCMEELVGRSDIRTGSVVAPAPDDPTEPICISVDGLLAFRLRLERIPAQPGVTLARVKIERGPWWEGRAR